MREDVKISLVVSPIFAGLILAVSVWTEGWDDFFGIPTPHLVIILILLFAGSFIFILLFVRKFAQGGEKRKQGGNDETEANGGA